MSEVLFNVMICVYPVLALVAVPWCLWEHIKPMTRGA